MGIALFLYLLLHQASPILLFQRHRGTF